MSDVYLGNPLLKKANTPIEFTEEQIIEFLKCKEDPVYFAKNYIKIVSLDKGLTQFSPYHFQEKLINNFHDNRFNICKMPRQTGKQLALDTKIPTPEGWTTIKELKIGDYIFGRDGNPSKVIGKSDIKEIDTYEIEFDNGEVIKACSDHLWKVSHSDWYHKEKVLKTKDIIKKFLSLKKSSKSSSIYVNISNSLNLPDSNVPIDPYTFGVWLGDGSRDNGAITGLYEDIEVISSNIPLKITKKSNCKGNVYRYYFEGLRKETHSLGLHKEKYIPKEYLRSSTNQRLELLRGLMDTDGFVAPNGACEFYQTRPRAYARRPSKNRDERNQDHAGARASRGNCESNPYHQGPRNHETRYKHKFRRRREAPRRSRCPTSTDYKPHARARPIDRRSS